MNIFSQKINTLNMTQKLDIIFQGTPVINGRNDAVNIIKKY